MGSGALERTLSDLIRLRRPHLQRMEFAAPWCVAINGCDAPGMYVIRSGVAQIDVFGTTTRLERGDCILLPRGGSAHVVGDALGTEVLEPDVIAEREVSDDRRVVRFRGPGSRTVMSAVPFDTRPLSWAPRIVSLPRTTQDSVARSLVRAYERALEHDDADVLGRIAEALWVRALGLLFRKDGYVDVDIFRAAAGVLDAPSAAHDLESLARAASLSRARFCARFTASFKVAPMKWVRSSPSRPRRATNSRGPHGWRGH